MAGTAASVDWTCGLDMWPNYLSGTLHLYDNLPIQHLPPFRYPTVTSDSPTVSKTELFIQEQTIPYPITLYLYQPCPLLCHHLHNRQSHKTEKSESIVRKSNETQNYYVPTQVRRHTQTCTHVYMC